MATVNAVLEKYLVPGYAAEIRRQYETPPLFVAMRETPGQRAQHEAMYRRLCAMTYREVVDAWIASLPPPESIDD